MSSDLSFDLTAWAAGPEGAVKLTVRMPGEHDLNMEIDLVRQASGVYRRTYHEWATETGHSHAPTPPEALERQQQMSRRLADGETKRREGSRGIP